MYGVHWLRCYWIGKTDQAEKACLKALEINSEDLTSMVSLARILVKKDKEGAEEASAKARILDGRKNLHKKTRKVNLKLSTCLQKNTASILKTTLT